MNTVLLQKSPFLKHNVIVNNYYYYYLKLCLYMVDELVYPGFINGWRGGGLTGMYKNVNDHAYTLINDTSS